MSNATTLPDVTVGHGEPATSRVLLTLIGGGVLGLLALFTNIFGWDSMPIIGDMVSLIGNLGGSGIWYYLIGIGVGMALIIGKLLAEVAND